MRGESSPAVRSLERSNRLERTPVRGSATKPRSGERVAESRPAKVVGGVTSATFFADSDKLPRATFPDPLPRGSNATAPPLPGGPEAARPRSILGRKGPMRSHDAVLSLLLLTLSVTPVFAQGPPPPPPPLQPLPPPPVPPGNPVTAAKANLGKVLFWDEQVSSTRTVACGSCHQRDHRRLGSTLGSRCGALHESRQRRDLRHAGRRHRLSGRRAQRRERRVRALPVVRRARAGDRTPRAVVHQRGVRAVAVLGRPRRRHLRRSGLGRHRAQWRRSTREPGRWAAGLERRDGTPRPRLDRRRRARRGVEAARALGARFRTR